MFYVLVCLFDACSVFRLCVFMLMRCLCFVVMPSVALCLRSVFCFCDALCFRVFCFSGLIFDVCLRVCVYEFKMMCGCAFRCSCLYACVLLCVRAFARLCFYVCMCLCAPALWF